MLRLYVPAAQIDGGRLRVTGAELRHLRTLRLEPGDRLVIFDDHGLEHDVMLERIGGREAWAAITASHRPSRESALDLVLAPALLKGTKMDLVIEKATELGVQRIAPIVTRHTIGQGAHVERWRRIAVAAAKQSGRTRVPLVDAPVGLAGILAADWPGLRLLAWEDERTRALATLPTAATGVVMVVGPEGGFSSDEVAAAASAGFVAIRLAPRVLRAETAAIVAAALCQHRWGDG